MLVVGILCVLYAIFLTIRASIVLRRSNLQLTPRKKQPRIAFLIPARYESAVIEGLLKSLLKQTVPVMTKDIYVIVENMDDPTVEICKTYGCSVMLREHVELQRKGYALDEAVKQILLKYHYDLYFVFDADNRVSPSYLEEMLQTYAAGYQMATGYRHARNNNRNVISAVSALTFTMINTVDNRNRVRHGANIIFSGTGCFVDGKLVEKWGGWPFHSLTEDYEMSLYAIAHNIATFYNEKAVFYDEQPTRYWQTVDQRIRWIKGYFEARHEYIPQMRKQRYVDNDGSRIRELIGVKPIIWLLVGLVCMTIGDVIHFLMTGKWQMMLVILAIIIGVVYVALLVATVIMIKMEKMHFTPKMKLQAVLFNPIYLLTYVPCALKALLIRNVEWKRIEHGRVKRR